MAKVSRWSFALPSGYLLTMEAMRCRCLRPGLGRVSFDRCNFEAYSVSLSPMCSGNPADLAVGAGEVCTPYNTQHCFMALQI